MTPYGCHSQPRKDGYWAKDGTYINECGKVAQLARWIEDRATKTCQYRKDRPTDQRCEGCTCP